MPRQAVTILDQDRNAIATAEVELRGIRYSGSIDLGQTPAPLRRLFAEYEEIVHGQVFSLLDQIEDQVAAASLIVSFEDGLEMPARNLQIFPEEGTISFEADQLAAEMRPGVVTSRGDGDARTLASR